MALSLGQAACGLIVEGRWPAALAAAGAGEAALSPARAGLR